jgi:hypothetical protein
MQVDSFSRSFLFDKAQSLLEEYEQSYPPSMPMHSKSLFSFGSSI